jgi:hypothetical protein
VPFLCFQRYDRRSPPAGFRRGVFEGKDVGPLGEDRSDDVALDAFAAAVNDPGFVDPAPAAFG